MKNLGTVLIIVGIVALIPAGGIAWKDSARSRSFDKKIKELTGQRAELRDELRSTNLEYRGYQNSIPTMPDSTKKEQSGKIMATYRDYNKKIRVLEMKEKEFTRLILRQQSMKDERNSAMVARMTMVGAVGLVLVVLGVVLVRRG